MEDVNISKYRASVVREGSKPASPGFVVSEGQSPTDPAGTGQNHLPVTIAAASTALSITESQILSGAGTVAQYIRGDGSLADFPESSGGGSSVSYYLNGSVNQGTIGGVAYKELNKVPILGAGTDFTINANGYIASFLTDAGDPNLLEIPGGNWNFETYFSANNGGGSPTFYVELYKYNGTTFTLLASNSAIPEFIAFGTNITAYFTTLAVPTTTLALTDRLAVRYYVTHSGRTITMHTEGPHLCQIITTFTTGLTALNGLTAQVQNFATGTTGTDFNIASATATHTFNLPTASATNRGALSSGDWTTFNGKENAITAGTTAQYFRGDKTFQTLNTSVVPELTNLYYTEARVNSNANVAANTAARHNAVTLGTANGLSLSTQVLSLGLASAGVTGALSGTDWSTFNSKQNALGYTPVPETRTITINGTTQDLSANRTFNVGTVTSVGLSSATSGVTIGSTPVTGSGTITLAIATASGSQNGLLSSTDWTTFNSKQNALTNPVTGTGTTNYLAKFTGSTTVGNSQVFDNGTNVGIGTASPQVRLDFGNSLDQAFHLYSSGSDYYGINMRQYDSGPYSTNIFSGDGGQIKFRTASGTTTQSTRMTLTASGNLLVGTTTDNGARLQVSGTGTFSDLLTTTYGTARIQVTSTTNNSNSGFRLGAKDSSGTTKNAGLYYTPGTTTANTYLALWADDNNPQLAVLANGNVGIGTTSPSARLHVEVLAESPATGAVALIAKTSNGANDIFRWFDGATQLGVFKNSGNVGIGTASPISPANSYRYLHIEGANSTSGGVLYLTTFGNGNSSQIYTDTSGLNINTNTSLPIIFNPAGAEQMRITSSGNVLIGTTTDVGARLHVNGDIRTAAPSGGSAVNWKLGTARGGTITPNAIVRVEIGGVLVDLDARYV